MDLLDYIATGNKPNNNNTLEQFTDQDYIF